MNKYIFFDFNGTIIDDVELCFNLLNKMLVEHGKSKITLEKYKEIFKFPIIEYYELAGFNFPEDNFSSLANQFILEYKNASKNCNLMKGILDSLEYLKSKGYILVCLSASEKNMLKKQLKFYKLEKYFESILGIDNIHASGKVDIAKVYMNNNNIDKNYAYMIGDTLHDKLVADEMGINCVLYSGGHQSYSRLLKTGKKVIKDFSELKDIFN